MPNVHRALPLAINLLVATAEVSAAQSTTPIGHEFQVSTYTLGQQFYSRVAVEDDGDFVVVWTSGPYHDGSAYGAFGQRYDSAGVRVGREFQINVYTGASQGFPDLGIDADGDFVVTWIGPQDGMGYAVIARRFASSGAAVGGELLVNSYTNSDQQRPAIAVEPDGDFVIVWDSTGQDGSLYGVFGRRFNAAGTRLAVEFQVNAYTSTSQSYPDVASDGAGNFVVAWQSADGSNTGVFARAFTSTGAAGSELQVNVITTNYQGKAAIARDADGDFVIAWSGFETANFEIRARRFNALATPQGQVFQVNQSTVTAQTFPAIAMRPDGEFAVVWESSNQEDPLDDGVFTRRFAADGTPETDEMQVNTHTQLDQARPSVGMAADGDFVVAWQSYEQDGDNYGVFGQRFATLAVLDIDGNGQIAALSDGLLVLRFMFGFTGTTLTSGAIGSGCTRCNAAAIEPYLAGLT
jgi:hypothetical protein